MQSVALGFSSAWSSASRARILKICMVIHGMEWAIGGWLMFQRRLAVDSIDTCGVSLPLHAFAVLFAARSSPSTGSCPNQEDGLIKLPRTIPLLPYGWLDL